MSRALICILSSNYSGSHFLSLMLGSHTHAAHIGELKNMVKGDNSRDCYICNDLDGCRMFDGINQVERAALYDTLFERAGEGVTHLVDASKKPKWFSQMLRDDQHEVYLVHLLRDPRALARRWIMRFEEHGIERRERFKLSRHYPLKAPYLMSTDIVNVCAQKWVYQNQEIADFLATSGRPQIRITYRDLALAPDETLGRICDFAGLSFEPSQKNYWEFEHHGTQKAEYEWVRQQQGATYFDQRWKTFLSERQVAMLENYRPLRQFMDGQGLSFCDEGLVLAG